MGPTPTTKMSNLVHIKDRLLNPPPTYVRGHGPEGHVDVMVVGEGPGKEEDASGLPFYDPHFYHGRWSKGGASGKELTRLLNEMAGIPRHEVFVTNLTRRYRGDGGPTAADVRDGTPDLLRDLRAHTPRIVLAVGRLATRHFLGDVSMEVVHGIPHTASINGWSGTVVPCYHPAAGLYSPDVQPLIAYDFQQAGLAATGKIPLTGPRDEYPNPLYIELSDDYDRTDEFKTFGAKVVAIDSEGDRRAPWGVQFSTVPGTGFLIRPTKSPKTLAAFFLWLATARPLIVFHNSFHDIDILRALGLDVWALGLPFVDTMVMAYHLQLEPQGLKPLAYRHCGMAMQDYADLVGPAAHDKAMVYLTEIAARTWPKVDPEWIREGTTTRLYQPQPAHKLAERFFADLASGKVNKEGLPPDPIDRWKGAPPAVKHQVEAVLGPMPTATLDDVPLPAAVHYSCRDADATIRVYPRLRQRVISMGLAQTFDIDTAVTPMVERMQHLGMPYDHDYFVALGEEMGAAMDRITYQLSKEVGHSINPNSPDQVAAILYGGALKQGGEVVADVKGRGFTPTKFSKKTGKPKTDKKAVEALRTTDKAVDLIIDYREHAKVRDSFAIPIARVRPYRLSRGEEDTGRCQCTMRITRVVTGRLSATALEQGIGANLLAIPVRTELGLKVRRGFRSVPCPHCGTPRHLGTFDLDQIEMRVMADESQDKFLIELFNDPRRDVHSETAARMFRVAGATHENKYAGVHKVKHRYPAKRVGFGVITGIQGPGLLDQMRMAGLEGYTVEECDRLIESWFDTFPGVYKYMQHCRMEAERDGLVRDRWGRIRYLPGASSPLTHIREEALRQSHSHKIQAGAQGIIKRAMAGVQSDLADLNEAFRTCDHHNPVECLLQIHDELVFEVDADPVLKAVVEDIVVDRLINTTPLSIPLGAKGGWGPDWASLEK